MENYTDIIVLTSVIIVLFLVFIIATVRELNTISTTKFEEKEEGGPRAEMMRFIGKIFTDDSIDAGKKITFMNAVKPIIEDMLPEEEKKKE
ncbi:MAG: hypothetical protein ABIU11_03600 [Chitinophagaceae bacterium]